MKYRRIVNPLAMLLLLFTSSAANAEFYVFGGGGIMAHEYTNVSNPSAYKFGAGVVFQSNLGLEASYMNLGTARTGLPSNLSMSGTNFSGVFDLPLNPIVMSFKAGIYNIDANDTTNGTASSSGFSWGILLGYQVNERMQVFMDTEGFANVNAAGGNFETPALITFGLRYRL